MVETYLEKDDWLLNTPFLQKIKGQAHKEGHEEGHEEEREEVAKNMKREGMPVEVIAKLTGLSIEEIREL